MIDDNEGGSSRGRLMRIMAEVGGVLRRKGLGRAALSKDER